MHDDQLTELRTLLRRQTAEAIEALALAIAYPVIAGMHLREAQKHLAVALEAAGALNPDDVRP